MDHLPYPVGATLTPAEVPFLARHTYDREGLQAWPERAGWGETFWESKSLSDDDLAGRVQSWLFFGLLSEFFDHVVEEKDFVRTTSNGVVWITAFPLRCHVQQWRNKVLALDEKERRLVVHVSMEAAALAGRLVEVVDRGCRAHRHSLGVTVLSIKCLSHSLVVAGWVLRQQKGFEIGPTENPMNFLEDRRRTLAPQFQPPPVASILKHRMEEAGWCPYQAQLLCERHSSSVVYYLSSLPRSEPSHIDHSDCLADACVANNVTNEEEYCPRHDIHCVSCPWTAVSAERLNEITRKGGIPMINVRETESGELEIEIIEFTITMKYVALSHVWSGGLGNFTANSMPSCQVRRIHQLVKSAVASKSIFSRFLGRKSKQSVFWIDTLCIPVGDPALRLAAIGRMAQVYAGARSVLVLDRELEQISMHATSKAQQCAYVMCSAWMSRSWTLHESSLGHKVLIQFADDVLAIKSACKKTVGAGKLDPFSEMKEASEQPDPSFEILHEVSALQHEMTTVGDNVHGSFDPDQPRLAQFIKVWNSLLLRSTTKMEDLHGIFATLVDLRASEVLQLSPPDRMRAILLAQEALPLAILFSDAAKLRDEPRNRWVPAFPSGSRLDDSVGKMELTEKGLLVTAGQSSCLVLEADVERTARFSLLVPGHEQLFFVELMCPEDDKYTGDEGAAMTSIILPNEILTAQNFKTGYLGEGARVAIYSTGDDDGTVRARYDCPVRIWSRRLATFEETKCPTYICQKGGVRGLLIDCDTSNWHKPTYRRPLDTSDHESELGQIDVRGFRTWLIIFSICSALHLLPEICQFAIYAQLVSGAFLGLETLIAVEMLVWILALNRASRAWWVLSFGDQIEISEPPKVIRRWDLRNFVLWKEEVGRQRVQKEREQLEITMAWLGWGQKMLCRLEDRVDNFVEWVTNAFRRRQSS